MMYIFESVVKNFQKYQNKFSMFCRDVYDGVNDMFVYDEVLK